MCVWVRVCACECVRVCVGVCVWEIERDNSLKSGNCKTFFFSQRQVVNRGHSQDVSYTSHCKPRNKLIYFLCKRQQVNHRQLVGRVSSQEKRRAEVASRCRLLEVALTQLERGTGDPGDSDVLEPVFVTELRHETFDPRRWPWNTDRYSRGVNSDDPRLWTVVDHHILWIFHTNVYSLQVTSQYVNCLLFQLAMVAPPLHVSSAVSYPYVHSSSVSTAGTGILGNSGADRWIVECVISNQKKMFTFCDDSSTGSRD